jgi:hypothetical protein
MKTKIFVLAVVLLSLGASSLIADGSSPIPDCAVMSWSPEVFTFYGDAPTVFRKLQTVDRNLLEHRVFAFIVETRQGAHLSLFELESTDQLAHASNMQLSSLRNASLDNLTHQITTRLLDNTGERCAGRIAHDMINQYAQGRLAQTTVSRPATLAEAFQEATQLADNGYIRATFILLC